MFLTFCLSLCAQSGLLITTQGDNTELFSGTEFTFGAVNSSEEMKTLPLVCGDNKIALSTIVKMEAFPPAISNGTSETISSPIESVGLQFVGVWNGPNHTVGTKTTPHPGIWEFHNDGTFSWNASDVKNHDMTGTWKYDPVAKLIATDSSRCPVLTVVSEFDDMIVLKNETYNQMYALKRETSPEVTLDARIVYFKTDGFVVRTSFVNYQFINQPEFKNGVAYSYSSDPENFQKVYTGNCSLFEAGNIGDNWTGLISRDVNYKCFGSDISLDGFTVGDKLILRPFAEFPDGTTLYGEDLKATVITPPADGLFLGDKLNNGYATFWFNKGFENGKVSDTSVMYNVYCKDIDDALKSIGAGWELPTSQPEIFRYHDGDKSSSLYLNIYSPVNLVNGSNRYGCGGYDAPKFFVKSGSSVMVAILGTTFWCYESRYGSTTANTSAYLLPCKRVKVSW